MSGTVIPAILAISGLLMALAAYRGIRRGAARFYTLERESMLRRAGFFLLASVVLFSLSVGLLVYGNRQLTAEESTSPTNAQVQEATATSEQVLQTQPPTETPTPTPDPNEPTATPTAIICRAVVDGTAGSGLTLREVPSGPEITILSDGAILTLLEEDPEEANGFVWLKVRTVSREEGWVVEDFLKIGDCR